MIYILKSGKFKKTNYNSIEKLIEVFNLERIYDTVGLMKEHNKGNNVYCWISPFQYEINGINVMYWGTDPEKELRDFHRSNEEV
jgi:hypothetical protein